MMINQSGLLVWITLAAFSAAAFQSVELIPLPQVSAMCPETPPYK